MSITAILVDGGFYLKQATLLFGEKKPQDRASELMSYCYRHLNYEKSTLYRVFYYDCPPSTKNVYHPLTQKTVDLAKTPQYIWMTEFFAALRCQRKVALRMGELNENNAAYMLKPDVLKKICRKTISIDNLTEDDFKLNIPQKGVDMKIGLDISSLAGKRLVNQIILIAGDSDFVPAAKHARREGIDFVLDPMWHTIKPSLYEHIDGLRSCSPKPNSDAKKSLTQFDD